MRIAFGTDEVAPLTEALRQAMADGGHELVLVVEDEPWPEVGRSVAEAVADGRAERGVVCCWTGTGVSIAANKVAGVRAALCADAETARGARRWNDANVLALGIRATAPEVGREALAAFLEAEPDVDELDAIARVEPAG